MRQCNKKKSSLALATTLPRSLRPILLKSLLRWLEVWFTRKIKSGSRKHILLVGFLTSSPCWSSSSVSSTWIHSSVQPYFQGQLQLPLPYTGLRYLNWEFLSRSLISGFSAFSLCFPMNHKQGTLCRFQTSNIPKFSTPITICYTKGS